MSRHPDPLPESELSAIAARADAATPGPWELQESHQGGAILLRGTENDNRLRRHPQSHLQIVPRSDAAFLAAARSDVPALVAEVRRLRAENERLEGDVVRLRAVNMTSGQDELDRLDDRVRELTAEVVRLKGPWPHGVRCAKCNRDITDEPKPGLPMSDAPDSFGETPVRAIVCAECWTKGGEL